MEKCPVCKFKTMGEHIVRNDKGIVVEASSKCKNCGHVKRHKSYRKFLRRLRGKS